MFPSAYLLVLLTQSPDVPPAKPVGVAARDELGMSLGSATLDFEWADAEDRVQGSISPRGPTEQAPLDVSAHVGTFQGAEFDGPVTLTLKKSGSSGGGQSKTLKRAAGERAWRASFVPEESGPYTLEISFLTSRLKVISGKLEVNDAKLSRLPWWILAGALTALALGLGVRSVFKKPEST